MQVQMRDGAGGSSTWEAGCGCKGAMAMRDAEKDLEAVEMQKRSNRKF